MDRAVFVFFRSDEKVLKLDGARCCSVAQSCPTLWPHGLQHIRPLCPSPSTKVCPSWCLLRRWCHPAISSSDALFSFFPQSFPASGTFPMSHLFTSDDQNTRVGAYARLILNIIKPWIVHCTKKKKKKRKTCLHFLWMALERDQQEMGVYVKWGWGGAYRCLRRSRLHSVYWHLSRPLWGCFWEIRPQLHFRPPPPPSSESLRSLWLTVADYLIKTGARDYTVIG